MATPGTTPECWTAHVGGLLACEPRFLRSRVEAIRARLLAPRAMQDDEVRSAPPVPYVMVGYGVAQIRIDGPMMKGFGKFGEFSTAFVRRALRAAAVDNAVGSVLLVFDSPGGYVAGTQDLANDVAAVNEVKPVYAYAEDLMASAAYWVAARARAIYANEAAQVGSIGVFAVLTDTSAAMDAAGVKVHVLSTGPLKGAGADGAPVTPEQLAAWQVEIDDTMALFEKSVRAGRQMTPKQFAAVATGGTWIASKAKDLGLIDAIRPLDEVVARLPKPGRPRAARAAAELGLLALDE